MVSNEEDQNVISGVLLECLYIVTDFEIQLMLFV